MLEDRLRSQDDPLRRDQVVRLDVELAVRVGRGQDLRVFEQTVRVGLLLHPRPKMDVLLAWRAGRALFRLDLPARPVYVNAWTVAAVAEIKYFVSPRLELRLAPGIPIGYWNEIWGAVGGIEAGMAWRF